MDILPSGSSGFCATLYTKIQFVPQSLLPLEGPVFERCDYYRYRPF